MVIAKKKSLLTRVLASAYVSITTAAAESLFERLFTLIVTLTPANKDARHLDFFVPVRSNESHAECQSHDDY